MTIEEELFKKIKINYEILIKFGFTKEENTYIYKRKFMNHFEVQIKIDGNEQVTGKVIDLNFDEEYNAFRNPENTGEFSGLIKETYINILEEIKKNCCKEKEFIFSQTNRITNFILKKYGDKPEFLWKNDDTSAVFRNKENKKWYGIIMNIKRDKIDKGENFVEILNVKLDKEKILELLTKKGYYKAYHMNKVNWITIILDDTLSDEQIENLIEESYTFTTKH